MSNLSLPLYGAEIEAFGVLGTFIGADLMDDGDLHFTLKMPESNVRLAHSYAVAEDQFCLVVGASLIQVSKTNCVWRSSPGFDVTDDEGFIAFRVDRHVRAAVTVMKFQRAISRFNRI